MKRGQHNDEVRRGEERDRSVNRDGGEGPAVGSMGSQMELFDLPPIAGFEPARGVLPPAALTPTMTSKADGEASVAESIRENTRDAPSGAAALLGLLTETEQSMNRRARDFAAHFQLGTLAEQVHVVWNARMRTAAGRAHYRECQIELNPRLAALPNATEEIERTFLHELAHLVAHHRHRGRKIQAHGPEWRRACAELGIPGESIYHQLPFEGRKIRRNYAYRCPVCGSEFERVKKFRRAVACYGCCKKHTWGAYDDRFRLVERRLRIW